MSHWNDILDFLAKLKTDTELELVSGRWNQSEEGLVNAKSEGKLYSNVETETSGLILELFSLLGSN